jgi:hypothetical protein
MSIVLIYIELRNISKLARKNLKSPAGDIYIDIITIFVIAEYTLTAHISRSFSLVSLSQLILEKTILS